MLPPTKIRTRNRHSLLHNTNIHILSGTGGRSSLVNPTLIQKPIIPDTTTTGLSGPPPLPTQLLPEDADISDWMKDELDDSSPYVPRKRFPRNPSKSPPTFQLNGTSSSHTQSVVTASEDNPPPKYPARSFFVIRYLIISLENIFFSFSTNCIRYSV